MESFTTREEARQKAVKRVKELKGFYNHLISFMLVNGGIALLVWYFGGSMAFFIWTVTIWWGLGLLIHAINTFKLNPFFGKKWEEKKIKELLENEH